MINKLLTWRGDMQRINNPFNANYAEIKQFILRIIFLFVYLSHQTIKMNITSTIITTADGKSLSLYDICRLLSKRQWKHVLEQLQEEEINIERIEAYEYSEARGIKHLFIRFKGAKEDTPFYLLSEKIFSKMAECIVEEFRTGSK